MQVFEPRSQHPVAQFCALQPAELPTHTWVALQVPEPASQLVQNSPALPHLLFAVPVSHRPVLTSMQPVQGVHAPLTQLLPAVQAMQAAPPVPQRLVVPGFWQTPVEVQQPLGQFWALQTAAPPAAPPLVLPPAFPPLAPPPLELPPAAPPPVEPGVTQRPPVTEPPSPEVPPTGWQICGIGHAVQLAPALPHDVSTMPVKHWAFSSQQPGQLAELQVTGRRIGPHDGVTETTAPTTTPNISARITATDSFMCRLSHGGSERRFPHLHGPAGSDRLHTPPVRDKIVPDAWHQLVSRCGTEAHFPLC